MSSGALLSPSIANATPEIANRNVSPMSGLAYIDVEHATTPGGTPLKFRLSVQVNMKGDKSEIKAVIGGVEYHTEIRVHRERGRLVANVSFYASSKNESNRAKVKVTTVVVRGKRVLLGATKSTQGKSLSVSLTLL
ncbi:MAG: hypothetical protein JKY56_06615 [Kofleriaceae bacterium]|nr:hypothetical protein [Kofleriaceae bacterium]